LLIYNLVGQTTDLVSFKKGEDYRIKVLSIASKEKMKHLSKLSQSLLFSKRIEEFDEETLVSGYDNKAFYESTFNLVYVGGPTSSNQDSNDSAMKTLGSLGQSS
jgi:hypothetical protein